MTNTVKFAELLIEFRGRYGWSQSELGEKVGVHRNTVATWESGTIPSRGMVLRLADELQLSKEEWNAFLKAAGYSIKHWPADYWNVPYKHNPYFIGREDILQSLRQRLIPGAKTTALTQSINGLGGIGKTQVAVEYAHRYGEYYTAVLWIQADSQEVATAAYLQLATKVLGLPEQQEAEQQIDEVKHWLQKRHGWLLIFDNVEDPEVILSTFVPSKHQGSVLITTRKRDLGALAYSEMLPLFSEEDAVRFLLRRAKRVDKEAEVTEAVANDFLLARELCHLLGRLPLALDQSGAYIAEIGCTLQAYINLYNQYRLDLLDRRGWGDHPESVLITFWLSWEQIQKCNILAGKALQFCAFLAPDQIPAHLVLDGIVPSEAKSTRDALEMDKALGLLYSYSLIERADQTLSLHRLVQEVIQEILSEEEQQYWMERAIRGLSTIFPSGAYGTWSQCEFLLPHALTCVKWVFALKQKKLAGAQLLGASGRYLLERGRYREAEPLLQNSLSIREKLLGPTHLDIANSLNNLAVLYERQRPNEAEPLLQRALRIAEECADPLAATILNNLAELYRIQDRYQEAEPLLQRALRIAEDYAHPLTASIMNNLALLYERQGRDEESELLRQRALHIAEEQLGPTHPQIVALLNNLAFLYRMQASYGKAEPLFQRALHIAEEQLGPTHPQTASCLIHLAKLYLDEANYGKAEPLFQRALAIYEERLGPTHPQSASSLDNLAELYLKQDRYQEAEPLLQQALRIAEEQLGPANINTAGHLNNLAELYRRQDRYQEAEPLFQRALAIYEERLGPTHLDTGVSLNNLADLYRRQDRYQEAEPLFQRALAIYEERLGPTHPGTAMCLNNFALLYESQKRYEEAERLHRRALSIAEEQLGPTHPDTVNSLSNLALLYVHQGRYEEAELLMQRALNASLASLGREHSQTQHIFVNYLAILSRLYTNGDMEALLQLLVQENQNEDRDEESAQA